MKKSISILALGAMAISSLVSCRKETNVSTVTGPYSSMQSIYSLLRLQPKTMLIDAATGGSFYGNSGTRYIVQPSSFLTATGANVTGNVTMQVCEYLQKGDMMFSKMLPVSNGEPLVSGGEISVTATQDGQSVFLKPYHTIQAMVPQGGIAPTDMVFFRGRQAEDTTQMNVNWVKPVPDSTGYGAGIFIVRSPLSNDTLNIISDSLGWANADQFLSSPNYQEFNVNLTIAGDSIANSTKVYGFAVYDQYKGVWPLSKRIGSHFKESHVPNFPVHFITYALLNGKFYGGILGATPATGTIYTVEMKEEDPTTFKAKVNDL